jgi:hypothetical protein
MASDGPSTGTLGYDDRGKGRAGSVPDLQARTVVAVFDRQRDVDDALRALQDSGHAPEDISVVLRDEGTPPQLSADESQSGKGTLAGASAGAVIGGAIGLSALALTGVGAVLAAGPLVASLAAALSGALTGGALGALAGSMAGLGVPTEEAERYEAAVRAGGMLIAVKTGEPEQAEAVERLLLDRGARDASSYTPSL